MVNRKYRKNKELSDFYNGLSVSDREDFVARCGTTDGYIRLIAGGFRKCSADLAVRIDRESGGVIRMESLRDDVDWEYVRNGGKEKVCAPVK